MPEPQIKRNILKIGILGDSLVGKTSIRYAFLKNEFDDEVLATIGVEKEEYIINLKKNEEIKIIILDVSGLQRFHKIAIDSILNTQGIILCFDVTNRKSFQNINNWLEMIKENINNVIIIIFGNKCDVDSEKREVTKEEAEEFAKSNNLVYFETSAKNSINIKEGFGNILNEAYYLKYKINLKEQYKSLDLKNFKKDEDKIYINDIKENIKLSKFELLNKYINIFKIIE